MAWFFCRWVVIAAAAYAPWHVVHGLFRPVMASLQFFSVLFRFDFPRWQQLPTVGGFVFWRVLKTREIGRTPLLRNQGDRELNRVNISLQLNTLVFCLSILSLHLLSK